MKKSVFILSFILLLTSCDNENLILEKSIFNETNFDVSVENNTLVFPKLEDYENAIEYLSEMDEVELLTWGEMLGFNSLLYNVDYCDNKYVQDELLGALLNENYEIIIGENKFILDLENEIVNVISNSKLKFKKEKSHKTYSTESNVIDIIFYGVEEDESGIIAVEKLKKSKKGPYYWQTSGGKLKYKVVYQTAGIYFSLQAKIKHTTKIGCNGWVDYGLELEGDNNYYKPRNKSKKKISHYYSYGNCSSYNYRPYSSTRRLTEYNYNVYFFYNDNNTGDYKSTVVGLKR